MIYCVYCGKPAVVLDHIIPIALGGTDSPENLVPACNHCNSVKHDIPPVEFLKKLLKLNGLPFKEEETPLPEGYYLVKEFGNEDFKLRIFQSHNFYYFKLISHKRLILTGDLLALKLLGYNTRDFQRDDISDLFLRLEMMHWIFQGLSEEDKNTLAEGGLKPPKNEVVI